MTAAHNLVHITLNIKGEKKIEYADAEDTYFFLKRNGIKNYQWKAKLQDYKIHPKFMENFSLSGGYDLAIATTAPIPEFAGGLEILHEFKEEYRLG